jgi:hypothetical protein
MGNVRLYGATSGYTELAPPAVAPDGVLSLPSGTGTIAKTTDQGLVHINTTTFSAVSSVSLDDVFSATYDNYRVLFSNSAASVNSEMRFRMRAASTDLSTSYYYGYTQPNISAATGAYINGSNDTSVYVSYNSSRAGFAIVDFIAPKLAQLTGVSFTGINASTTGNTRIGAGFVNNATAYDGITFFPGSGTITGTIRVYGYKNGA